MNREKVSYCHSSLQILWGQSK